MAGINTSIYLDKELKELAEVKGAKEVRSVSYYVNKALRILFEDELKEKGLLK